MCAKICIKVDGYKEKFISIAECINTCDPPTFETIDELPGYKFNVISDILLPYTIEKNSEGEWCIKYSNEIRIEGNIITCNKHTFKRLKDDICEFNKFKEWLNKQQKYKIVYVKNTGGE